MPLSISISKYRPHDGPAILEIYPEFIEERAGQFHRSTLLVARHRGRAVGFLFIVWYRERAYYEPRIRRFAEIQEVHVHREFRNRGIATALVRRAIREAESRKCEAVYLETDATNAAARRVYEKCAFAPHGLVIRYKRPLE